MKLHLMVLLAFFPLTRSSNNQTTFTNESDNLTAVTKPTKNITVAATKNNSTTGSNQNLTVITKPPSNETIVAKQNTNLTTKQPSKELLLEGVYWEIKPYIFINQDGQLDGIIPMIFREAQKYCIKRNDSSMYELMQFQQHMGSRQEYFELVRSRKNSNDSKVVYLPDISFAYLQDEHLAYDRGLKSVELLKSKLAVIVPRYMISLPNKIVRGIGGCKQILVLAFMLSILFGMVVWLVERPFNDNFPSSFFRGTGQSLWWSIVSMTTVGYGDVVPRTLLGRVIAVVWLYLGVILACVVTATVTGIVTGISDLTIYKQKVAVLQNSFESKVAQDDYSAKIVPAQSYTEVLQLVRSGDAFAALMNLDVASWLQDEINSNTASVPLRVIEILPRNVFVQALMSKQANVRAHEALACMHTNHSDEVIQRSSGHFQRHLRTETLHIETLYELFRYNLMYQLLVDTIVVKLKTAVETDLYIPLYSKAQLEANNSKSLALLERQFWKGYKLLGNLMEWNWMLSQKKLQELGLDAVLNRYLIIALQQIPDHYTSFERAKKIVNLLPKEWFEKSDSIIAGLQSLARYLVFLAGSVQKSLLGYTEETDKRKAKILVKKIISLLMHIQAFDQARTVAQNLKEL